MGRQANRLAGPVTKNQQYLHRKNELFSLEQFLIARLMWGTVPGGIAFPLPNYKTEL